MPARRSPGRGSGEVLVAWAEAKGAKRLAPAVELPVDLPRLEVCMRCGTRSVLWARLPSKEATPWMFEQHHK